MKKLKKPVRMGFMYRIYQSSILSEYRKLNIATATIVGYDDSDKDFIQLYDKSGVAITANLYPVIFILDENDPDQMLFTIIPEQLLDFFETGRPMI